MQAIQTKFHGPTDTKGSRYSAQAEAGRIYVSADHALNSTENHKAACEALLRKLGWNADTHGAMCGGQFGDAYYWVFIPTNPTEWAQGNRTDPTDTKGAFGYWNTYDVDGISFPK